MRKSFFLTATLTTLLLGGCASREKPKIDTSLKPNPSKVSTNVFRNGSQIIIDLRNVQIPDLPVNRQHTPEATALGNYLMDNVKPKERTYFRGIVMASPNITVLRSAELTDNPPLGKFDRNDKLRIVESANIADIITSTSEVTHDPTKHAPNLENYRAGGARVRSPSAITRSVYQHFLRKPIRDSKTQGTIL